MRAQPTDAESGSGDCEKIRQQVQEFLDGELEDPVATAIVVHIQHCAHCGCRITFEAAFLRAVTRAKRDAPVPAAVEARVASLLAEWSKRTF
jgi:anti-sigma factor (TIGR02949 family)